VISYQYTVKYIPENKQTRMKIMSVTNKKKQLQTRATVRKINARNGPKPADSQ